MKKGIISKVLIVAFVAAFTLIIWLMDLAVTPVFQWLIG